jgi:translation elongation factor P/translation initiation factor 5A
MFVVSFAFPSHILRCKQIAGGAVNMEAVTMADLKVGDFIQYTLDSCAEAREVTALTPSKSGIMIKYSVKRADSEGNWSSRMKSTTVVYRVTN